MTLADALRDRLASRRVRRRMAVQLDLADCGPAAVLTALRLLGGDASLEQVRRLAGSDASGTSVFGLVRAANLLGMSANPVSGTYDELVRQRMPLVAHVVTPEGRGHFVTVWAAGADRVSIADPSGVCRDLEREEFEGIWTRVAILLDAAEGGVHQAAPLSPLQWLSTLAREKSEWVVQSIFSGLICATCSVLTAVCLRFLLDKAVPSQRGDLAVALGGAFISLNIARIVVNFIRQTLNIRFYGELAGEMAASFVDSLLDKDARFFSSRRAKDLSGRLTDLASVSNAMVWVAGEIVVDGLIALAALAMLLATDLAPGLWAVLGVLALVAFLVGPLQRLSRLQRESLGAFSSAEAALLDAATGIACVKSFDLSALFKQRLRRGIEIYVGKVGNVRRASARIGASAELLSAAVTGVVVIYGAHDMVGRNGGAGLLVQSYALVGLALPSVARVVQATVGLQAAQASALRLRETMDAPAEPAVSSTSEVEFSRLQVRDAQVAHPDGRPLLGVAKFDIRRGEVVLMSGSNGAGKSTFLRCLQGMSPITGDYRLDGIPAEALPVANLRRAVCVVGKNPYVFSATLAENLFWHVDAADREAAMARLSSTGLLRFFESRGIGFATHVGEGGRPLSSGEQQVVGLARALAGAPAFLVLDEAFSAMDPDTRQCAMAAVIQRRASMGVVIVDHHIAAIDFSRRYVIENSVLDTVAARVESTSEMSHCPA